MIYHSLQEICEIAEEKGQAFWEAVRDDDGRERQVSWKETDREMKKMAEAMRSADSRYQGSLRSAGRMAGGNGEKIGEYNKTEKNLSGAFIGKVMERAVKMAETNACMGRIVAAPTAGSCGVLPAVLLTYEEFYRKDNKTETEKTEDREDQMLPALYTAAGIGQVIADRASLAGAEGGCQAEIGAASAMAAGALVCLQQGNSSQICDAAALALKGLLGLTCDPVAGLVEVPCVKRNVLGAVNAVTSADMAMAGIHSVIPADEVIDAMGETGREMSAKFRETSRGGLAVTPTGIRIAEQLRQEKK